MFDDGTDGPIPVMPYSTTIPLEGEANFFRTRIFFLLFFPPKEPSHRGHLSSTPFSVIRIRFSNPSSSVLVSASDDVSPSGPIGEEERKKKVIRNHQEKKTTLTTIPRVLFIRPKLLTKKSMVGDCASGNETTKRGFLNAFRQTEAVQADF